MRKKSQYLLTPYSKPFIALHMNKELYLRYAGRGIPMTEAERARLQQSYFDWDPDLAKVMVDRGVKLHQELWVAEMVLGIENI